MTSINKISMLLIATVLFASCAKKGCMDPTAANYDSNAEKTDDNCDYSYTVPQNYEFTDENGNNTVSFTGQTARMDMLSEMVTYLKTANNNAAVTLDAAVLLSMYDNTYTNWDDSELDDNGKQLKNKTALGDAGIQAMFEGWMTAAAAATPSTNTSYLQDVSGLEWTQVIEKGLMSACFVSQMTSNYLGEISEDNNTEIIEGKYYTEMEHHWDEAYGYFTDAPDYPTNGTNRFWGKYANKSYLEDNIGSATDIATAFRTGRAAIASGNIADALYQAEIIKSESKQMVAGMALHYLNDVKAQVSSGGDQSSINHSMSEALAFIYGIQFVTDSPDMSYTEVMSIVNQIEPSVAGISQNIMEINSIIDQVAAASGLTDKKNDF